MDKRLILLGILFAIGAGAFVLLNGSVVIARDYTISKNPPTHPDCETAGSDSPFADFDKLDCYYELAQRTGDVRYCARAGRYNSTKYLCMYEASNDLNYCQYVDPKDQGIYRCYMGMALDRGDVSFCAMMTKNQDDQDACYRDVGIKLKDVSICESIIDDRDKEKCNNGAI
jgi:hypothetical protein